MPNTVPDCQRPLAVSNAIVLLWASLGLGLFILSMDAQTLKSLEPALISNISLSGAFGFVIYVTINLSARRNWARFLLLATVIPGLTLYGLTSWAQVMDIPIEGGLILLQAGIQLYALILLFSKSANEWYRKAAPAGGEGCGELPRPDTRWIHQAAGPKITDDASR